MRPTRRALLGVLASACAGPLARADDAALSAAVLAISLSHPRLLDDLKITGESGAISLSAYRGKLVILNLWASWCLPCRREMPSLSRLATLLKGKPCVVLPLSLDRRGLDSVRAFYAETGISNLPVLAGDIANVQAAALTPGLPSTFLLDDEGLLRWSVSGEAQWDDHDSVTWIRSLLPR